MVVSKRSICLVLVIVKTKVFFKGYKIFEKIVKPDYIGIKKGLINTYQAFFYGCSGNLFYPQYVYSLFKNNINRNIFFR